MSHPMIHLAVAKHILDDHPEIKKPEQFYLGSLAPDAVQVTLPAKSHLESVGLPFLGAPWAASLRSKVATHGEYIKTTHALIPQL